MYNQAENKSALHIPYQRYSQGGWRDTVTRGISGRKGRGGELMKDMYILSYILIINFITFLVFGEDKRRARKQLWRISEKTLMLLAAAGGSIGAAAGMRIFHHKTKKRLFRAGIPIFIILHVFAVLVYFNQI